MAMGETGLEALGWDAGWAASFAAFAAAGVTTPMVHPFLFEEAAMWRALEALAPA